MTVISHDTHRRSMLDQIDLNDLGRQAREVRFGVTVLRILAGLIFGLGWLVAKTFAVAWLSVAWVAVTFREGWRSARIAPVRVRK